MRPASRRYLIAWLALVGFSACTARTSLRNRCSSSTDCVSGSQCVEGWCQASGDAAGQSGDQSVGDSSPGDPVTGDNLGPPTAELSFAGARDQAYGMAVLDGFLYFGTGWSDGHGDIYVCDPTKGGVPTRCDSVADWFLALDTGFQLVNALVAYNGTLYAAMGDGPTGARLWRCEPSVAGVAIACDATADWDEVLTDPTYETYLSFAELNGVLYATVGGQWGSGRNLAEIQYCSPATAGDPTLCDTPSDWSTALTGPYNSFKTLVNVDGDLFAGAEGHNGDGDIWLCTPTVAGDPASCDVAGDWSLLLDATINNYVLDFETFNGRIYATTGDEFGLSSEILMCDPSLAADPLRCDNPSEWSSVYQSNLLGVGPLLNYDGRLLAGTFGASLGDGRLLSCGDGICQDTAWSTTWASPEFEIYELQLFNDTVYASTCCDANVWALTFP